MSDIEETGFKLPGGHIISMRDLTWQDLYGAFVVDPWADTKVWYPFSYSRAQPLEGAVDKRPAQRTHTNLVRPGDAGLPSGWEMFVCRWRASINMPMSEETMAWAAETSVRFIYNQKPIASATLDDLLLAGRPIASNTCDLPVHVQEFLGFGVEVTTESAVAMEAFQDSLHGVSGGTKMEKALERLSVLEGLQRDTATKEELQKIQRILRPGRELICWIHLEGPMFRSVI
jgi:hypothetical protein